MPQRFESTKATDTFYCIEWPTDEAGQPVEFASDSLTPEEALAWIEAAEEAGSRQWFGQC